MTNRDTAGRLRATRRDTSGRVRNMWSQEERAEAALNILGDAPAAADRYFGTAERLNALAEQGFVPAIAAVSATRADSRRGINESWAQSFAIAGHDKERRVPKMPDNATVAHLAGNSLDGERRTYRRKYGVDGWTFRPQGNVKAINRVMSENNWRTMDITVDTLNPEGKAVKMEVRVTRGNEGQWAVTPLDVRGANADMVAAGVQAILESKRPTQIPTVAGGLAARARANMSSAGVELTDNLTSTWMAGVSYADSDGMMVTRTLTGRVYGHSVPRETFETIANSTRPGEMFNELVKKTKASPVNVAQCGRCQRHFAMSRTHRCPIEHHTPKAVKNASKMQNNRWRAAAEAIGSVRRRRTGQTIAPQVASAAPAPQAAVRS